MSRPASALARLLAEPRRFSFDAALRVLTFARGRAAPSDAVRFASVAGAAFPAAEVTEVGNPGEAAPPRITVGLMGLAGPSGVLPRHYSDAVVAGQRSRSLALGSFLETLAHRMLGAFAAAGAKYRPHRSADQGVLAARDLRGPAGSPRDPIGGALLALTGYDMPGFVERLPTGAAPFQHYAGLFASRPRSAERLEAMVSDWLERRVTVQQFAGAWLALPMDQRSRLPAGLGGGAFHRLGADAAVGVRAWDQQARVVLKVGPLDLPTFNRLLPDGEDLPRLVSLVRAYLGFETGFAINPVLAKAAVPPLIAGGQAGTMARLGWNAWLPSAADAPRRVDAAEAVFEAEIVESRMEQGRMERGRAA
ncbi:MAG: type VI secretion system baseplate subunit TssG [Acetobacteraceae bacterium]